MKFTILSHAGMLVESGGVSVLLDPWLVGSCYWRGWFNLPEPERELIDGLAPDWIYLTHLHWDHFHGPSLRRFSRETPVLIPRIPSTRMVRDLHYLGFSDVREIPHGRGVQLAPQFTLHSFQFDPVAADSTAVLQDADATLLDANDCKCFGLSLRQIKKRFPNIDFAFRSHSNASCFPYCIEGYETDFSALRTKQNYLEEFAAFTRAVGARYAVPFASNFCFLHPQTRHFNDTIVLPDSVAAHMAETKSREDDPQCVVMAPGSSWSSADGFAVRDFDYGGQMEYVESLSRRYAGALAAQQDRESSATGDFDSFKRYFGAFIAALGWPLRRLLPTVCFAVEEAGRKRFWRVDFRGRRIEELSADPDILTITVPALVINDCCRKKMFSVWTPSRRLRIRFGPAKFSRVYLLINLLDFHEHEQLPLRRFFSRRTLSVWRRRWREPLDLVWGLVVLGWLRRPVKSIYGRASAAPQ